LSYIQLFFKALTTCPQSLSKITLSKPLDVARRRACCKAVASRSRVVTLKGKIFV
jgi:hypothetical protein